MATSKIEKPCISGTVIAESTGNKTIAQHLSVLAPAYSALNGSQRRNLVILLGNEIYRIVNIGDRGIFSCSVISGSTAAIIALIFDSGGPTCYQCDIKTSGVTIRDLTNESLNKTVQLAYL